MKLTESTMAVLQNFAAINQSLLFNKGNVLKTISPQKTIFAEVKIPEDVPSEFGIYDLNQFLAALSLVKTPELDIHDTSLTISDEGGASIDYWFADKSMIITPPDKSLKLNEVAIDFKLDAVVLKQALQAARVLDAPELSVVVKKNELFLQAGDSKNSASNRFNKKIDDIELSDAKYVFKVDNLKLMVLDYRVEISSQGIAKFTSTDEVVTYFIATETKK